MFKSRLWVCEEGEVWCGGSQWVEGGRVGMVVVGGETICASQSRILDFYFRVWLSCVLKLLHTY